MLLYKSITRTHVESCAQFLSPNPNGIVAEEVAEWKGATDTITGQNYFPVSQV